MRQPRNGLLGVRLVLDPCYDVRARLLSSALKAENKGAMGRPEARTVLAASRWYAHLDGRLVTVLGVLTGAGLQRSGFVDAEGSIDDATLTAGVAKVQAEIVKRMNKLDPISGFQVRIVLIDLAHMRASEFVHFAFLLR